MFILLKGLTVKTLKLLAGSLASLLVLAACGGGGGGGAGFTLLPGLSITQLNSPTIASQAMESADVVQGASQGAGFITGVAVSGGGTSGSDFNLQDFVLDQLASAMAVGNSQGGIGGITVSDSVPCSSGRIDFTITIADQTGTYLTAGDRIGLNFVGCNNAGILMNGGFTMVINAITPFYDPAIPPSAFILDVSVSMNNFSVNDGLVDFSANGDMAMAFDVNGNAVTLTLSGNGISVTDGVNTETLAGYNYSFIIDDSTGDFTVSLNGTISSALLNGSVSFQTTSAFTGNSFVAGGNPTAGSTLFTTDIDNSSAILTAQADGSTVIIDVDEDGDGIYEIQIVTDWATIGAP
jgi:hypothetical protein